MKVLVTGAAGFVGYHLVLRLAELGHEVLGTVRADASADSVLRIERLKRSRFFNTQLRITHESVAETVRAFKPDACMHLAGKSAVRQSVARPLEFVEANYAYTAELLEALRRNDCRRMIHASSVMVYGKDAPIPYREDQIGIAPASPYGATKLGCEILCNTWNQLHGMENVNLRLFSVYGPEIRPDCVPALIARAILTGSVFNVFGDGSSERDYIDIDDTVAAFVAALNTPGPQNALNIGSGEGTSLISLIRILEGFLKKKANIQHKPAAVGELQRAVPDVGRARQTLNWAPKMTIEDGMKRLAAWFADSGTAAR